MKRLIFLVLIGFWGAGVFFLIQFFANLPSTYRPKASLAKNSVLKIIPRLSYSGQKWTEPEKEQLAARYAGLIIQSQDFESVKKLKQDFRLKNPNFKLYLEISPRDWFSAGDILDVRDPLYRQEFFKQWQTLSEQLNIDGIYLTGVASPSPYDWWEMSMLDFMAQIRQYFGGWTILFEAAPIANQNQNFVNKMLLQTDGMVITDFASIAESQETFANYYTYLSGLLQDFRYQDKQFIYHPVTADSTKQLFFQASYLLFANGKSAYYFASTPAVLNWQTEWEYEYRPSLNLAVKNNKDFYERKLGNVVVKVWPETLNSQIVSLPAVNVSPTQSAGGLAEWSDLNSGKLSDFEDMFLLRNPDSLFLGERVSVELNPKTYDDYDDGLQIDGLEAGIFNLNRSQTYDFRIKLGNLNGNGAEVKVLIDWDGSGNLPPETVYQTDFLKQKISFSVTVPKYAADQFFVRVIAADRGKGEVEDYVLNAQ